MRADDILDSAVHLAGFGAIPPDSCVAHDTGRPVGTMMASINATAGDLLLAKRFGADAYLLHHPAAGAAARDRAEVLTRMIDLLMHYGVPQSAAISCITDLRRDLRLRSHASDWDALVSAASLLDLTLINVHLPADELGRQAMIAATDDLTSDDTLDDLRAALRTIPELAHPGNEILLVPDRPNEEAGRVAVMHGAGACGGADVAIALFEETSNRTIMAVRTAIYGHLDGADAKRLEARAESGATGSVVVSGRLATSAIGMNRLITALESSGIRFIRHGGLRPFSPDALPDTAGPLLTEPPRSLTTTTGLDANELPSDPS